MALKQVKNKIISTKKTGQVTKAMESVSAVKMRKSQEKAFASRPFVHAAMRILSKVANSDIASNHPFMTDRSEGKHLLVIVTSDKGLAGSVNSAVLKRAEEVFKTEPDCDVIAIGRKAVEFAVRSKKELLGEYTNLSDEIVIGDMTEIGNKLVSAFTDSQYKKVEVLYQNFISAFEQEPTKRQVLPIDPSEVHYILQGIRPKEGKFSEDIEAPDSTVSYTVEPSAEAVLDSLIPRLVQILLFHALLESKASEHSARMVAMKNASDKSKEVIKALTIEYNKERQAAITAEVSEITAGAEAMK